MRRLGQGIAVALIVMLLAYPLSYFALLDPIVISGGDLAPDQYYRGVVFRGLGFSPRALTFYKPLLMIDGWIRPGYWAWTEQDDLTRTATP